MNLAVFERMVHTNPPDLADIHNFLLLQHPQALGTAIHATPLIAAIHAVIPNARVSAAASGFALEILRNNPGLETLVPTPSPLRELMPAANALRRAKPFGREHHITLLTTGNERSRVMLSALLAGSPIRAGFTVLPELAAADLNFDPRLSQIANNLRILELLGHGPELLHQLQANPKLLEPMVYFSSDDLDAAQTLLQEANPLARPLTGFVLQGSGGQRTGWHDDRFAAVIRHAESLGHQTIFLGTASDAANIDRIRSLAQSTGQSLAGRTSITQLTALLCQCDLLVTLDTGTMHLGRAASLPMVVLGPSWQKPHEWLPLGKQNVRILRGEDREDVPPGYLLDEINVPDVIAAIDELQRVYPASSQAREQRVSRLLQPGRGT